MSASYGQAATDSESASVASSESGFINTARILKQVHFGSLLALFSIILLVEGITRINAVAAISWPSSQWDGTARQFPVGYLLLAGVFQCLSALLSLGCGIHQMLPRLTTANPQRCQKCFAHLNFIASIAWAICWMTWTIGYPMYLEATTDGSLYAGISARASPAITTLEIIGGASYNSAVQLSQVFFSQKVYRLQSRGCVRGSSNHRVALCMLIWSTFLFLIGASQFLLNVFVHRERGSGRYETPVLPPAGPFVVAVWESGITAGCVLTVLGLWSIARSLSYLIASPISVSWGAFCPKLMVLAFLVQIGLQNVGQSGYTGIPGYGTTFGAVMVGLMFTVAFMPGYLDWLIRAQFETFEGGEGTMIELTESVLAKAEHVDSDDKHLSL